MIPLRLIITDVGLLATHLIAIVCILSSHVDACSLDVDVISCRVNGTRQRKETNSHHWRIRWIGAIALFIAQPQQSGSMKPIYGCYLQSALFARNHRCLICYVFNHSEVLGWTCWRAIVMRKWCTRYYSTDVIERHQRSAKVIIGSARLTLSQ